MKILSLFDGMACGRLALDRAGITVDAYYASEIDKYAMQIAKKNWPDIEHIGDVTQVQASALPNIDLLIGGSPCQGFSFAGQQLNFDDPRSKLFFEYVRLLKECKPEFFLLENVVMKKEFQAVITEALGVEPILINSALVSAQNRKRLYWTNIPGIEQPGDKGILLEDILDYETNMVKPLSEKEMDSIRNKKYSKPKIMPDKTGTLNTKNNSPQWSNDSGTTLVPIALAGRQVGRARVDGKRIDHKQSVAGIAKQEIEINKNPGKTNALSTAQKDNLIYTPHEKSRVDSACDEVGHAELNGHDFLKREYSPKGKCPTLTAVCGGNQERKVALDKRHWRKLTPLECERLQTVPDGYTEGVSNTQRYKMLGNGWTIDVIAHIFKNLYLLT